MRVGEHVGVVGQEDLVVTDEALDRLESLADVRVRPVSTNEIRQLSMSDRSSVTSRPPFSSTKSLVSASL